MPISLTRLEAFLAIIDEGGLNSAARRLGISQPTLSSTLARLEREARVKLFERLPTGLVPTAAARTLEPTARQAVAHRQALQVALEGLRDGQSGLLTVAAMPSETTIAFFPRVMQRFAAEYPGVQCRGMPGPSLERVLSRVSSGAAEVGIAGGTLDPPGLLHVHLPGLPQSLVLPPGLGEVAGWDALRRRGRLEVLESPAAPVEPVLAAEGLDTVVATFSDVPPTWFPLLVLNGLGAAVMPTASAVPLRASGCSLLPVRQSSAPVTLLVRPHAANRFGRRFVQLACEEAEVADPFE